MIRPILFNTEMVKAILDGRKTVTRRPIKPRPPAHCFLGSEDEGHTFDFLCGEYRYGAFVDLVVSVVAPFVPGDVLWVRECWAKDSFTDGYIYPTEIVGAGQKWRPSIHMPKDAARIFLRVTSVRAEKLQEIDDSGVVAEGLEIGCFFDDLWNSTIKPADRLTYGWDSNPWVWVIEFEKCDRPEGFL